MNHLVIEDDIHPNSLLYKTAQTPSLGLGMAYKWIVGLMELTPLYRGNSASKGAIDKMDLQWNMYFKAISADIRYQMYQGYYWDESHTNIYTREDIMSTSYGFNIRYNFNSDKFSQRAIFSQNERQLKSAGSLSIGLRWNQLNISADSSFKPSKHIDLIKNFNVNSFQIMDQGLGLGYKYSYVKKSFFVSVSIMPYVLYQNYNYKNVGEEHFNTVSSFQYILQTRGAIGINGKRDYYGFMFVRDQMKSRWNGEHNIGYNFANFKIIYARRIKLPNSWIGSK